MARATEADTASLHSLDQLQSLGLQALQNVCVDQGTGFGIISLVCKTIKTQIIHSSFITT
jgi:hypothetical protein